MSTGQIRKELYEKKVKEQIEIITKLEQKEELWDYLDTLMLKQVLKDSIKYYYEK